MVFVEGCFPANSHESFSDESTEKVPTDFDPGPHLDLGSFKATRGSLLSNRAAEQTKLVFSN